MSTEFALDLRLARRKAGLTQRDVAHLLAAQQRHVSALERGHVLPTIAQIVTLSLIFGRSFESLFAHLMAEAKRQLRVQLASVPDDVRGYVGTFNRTSTLARIRDRIADNDDEHGRS